MLNFMELSFFDSLIIWVKKKKNERVKLPFQVQLGKFSKSVCFERFPKEGIFLLD